LIRATFLALAILFGLVGGAGFATPVQAAARGPNADLAEISAYTAAQQQVVTDASGLISLLVQGIKTVGQFPQTAQGARDGKRWADAWGAQMLDRVQATKSWKSRLPPVPQAAFDRQLAGLSPEMRALYADMPARVEATMTSLISFVEKGVPLVQASAAGNDAARMGLAVEMFRGIRLMLDAERELLEGSISGMPANHPQSSLSKCMLANNRATAFYLDYLIAVVAGEAPDGLKLAASIRAQTAVVRTQAATTDRLAKGLIGELRRRTLVDPMTPRLIRMFETYDESTNVEVRVADFFDDVAVAMESGSLDLADNELRAAKIQGLSERRMALHAERLAAVRP